MTLRKARRAVCTEGCSYIVTTLIVIVGTRKERKLVVARVDVVGKLRISGLTHIVEYLAILHIIVTFVSEAILRLRVSFADYSLLADQNAHVVVRIEGLFPLQGVMVG